MNWPHLHLIINHFPVILSVVAAVAAIVGLFVRRRIVWIYATISLTLAGILAGPAFITGKQAGIVVEHMENPPKKVIEAHEESGETALFVLLGAGVIGAFGWWRLGTGRDTGIPATWLRVVLTIAALAGAGTAGYTSLLGGMIYHGPAGNARPSAWDTTPGATGTSIPQTQ